MASSSLREIWSRTGRGDLEKYLSKWGRVWMPNAERYEHTGERVWHHIARNTPAGCRIVVCCPSRRVAVICGRHKPSSLDMGDRKVEFVVGTADSARGLSVGKGDYLLIFNDLLEDSAWATNAILPLLRSGDAQNVFYRQILGPLTGDVWFEITSPHHPFWQQLLAAHQTKEESMTPFPQ